MDSRFFMSMLALLFCCGVTTQVAAETKDVTEGKSDAQKSEISKKPEKTTTKIGFVNVGQLLGAAPQAQESKEILEKEFADRDKNLVEKQNNIIEKEKQYQKDLAILSETQRSKREREIISLKRDFKRLKEEFEEDLALRKNEELRKLQKIVAVTIDKVAAEGSYDLIVNEGVIYASKNIDISLLILEELKKQAKPAKTDSKKTDAKDKKK